MKIRILSLLLALTMLMTACGAGTAQNVTEPDAQPVEEQQPEILEEDQLPEEPEGPESIEDTEDTLAPANGNAAGETADPAVCIYLPNEDFTGLVKESVGEEITDVRQLVSLLVERQVLPEGTSILSLVVRDSSSFYPYVDNTTKYVVGSQWIELDMSGQFLQAFENVSAEQEALVMASLTNTLLGYYGLKEMTILCEGAHIETAHDRYDYDLTFQAVE